MCDGTPAWNVGVPCIYALPNWVVMESEDEYAALHETGVRVSSMGGLNISLTETPVILNFWYYSMSFVT